MNMEFKKKKNIILNKDNFFKYYLIAFKLLKRQLVRERFITHSKTNFEFLSAYLLLCFSIALKNSIIQHFIELSNTGVFI